MKKRFYFVLEPGERDQWAVDYYTNDLENIRKKKPLSGKEFFKDKVVMSDRDSDSILFTGTAKIEKYQFTKIEYLDFLLIRIFCDYLSGFSSGKLSSDQMEYIIKLNAGTDLSSLNGASFNALFSEGSNDDSIWKVLNNNPGGFWENQVDSKIKPELSYIYKMQKLIFPNLGSFKELYASFDSFGYSYDFEFPQAQYNSNGVLEDRGDNFYYIISKDTYNLPHIKEKNFFTNFQTVKFDSDKKFVTGINSSLFFTRSQVEGIREVKEGTKTHKLVKKDFDKLVELGKTDSNFNVFNTSMLGQKDSSSIKKYIKDLITGIEDYSLGTIDGGTTAVTLVARLVGKKGEVTATDAEIEEFVQDEDSDFNSNISQCLLITDLANIGQFRAEQRINTKTDVDIINSETWSYPYGGRIYCLDTNQDKSFLNCLNVPNGMNEFIKHTTKNDFNNHFKYDFLLYKSVEEDGRVLEYPYLFESDVDDTGKVPSAVGFNFENEQGLSPEEIRKQVFVKTDIKSKNKEESKKIQISNVEISIEGDTPATVKSNIDVKITFTVPTLDAIQAVFGAQIKDPDKPDKFIPYEYSLVELLSYNIGQKYDGTQAARALTTSYIPNKNRLVMKIAPKVIIENADTVDKGYFSSWYGTNYPDRKDKILRYAKNSELILDLTLVNYSVDRTFDHKKADTITIEYKGFTKSFLNEPFCDILLDNTTKQELADIEKATIDDLSTNPKYCDLKNIRKRISKHFEDMRVKKDQNEGQNGTILKKLSDINQIYTLTLENNIMSVISNNIDKKTKKILRPAEVHELVNKNQNITVLNDNPPPSANVIDNPNTINFFYFGDLIDVCMDFIYGDAKLVDGKRKLDKLRDDDGAVLPDLTGDNISEIRKKFANFPLKVILPTFYPTVYDPITESFDTSVDPADKISIADIPIAVSYFQRWYEEEITDKKVKTYPLASFVSRILNSIINNILSDNCYNIGNIQRRYFNIRSDFGTFTGNKKSDVNDKFFKQNLTRFDYYFNSKIGTYFPVLETKFAPYLKKSISIPRNKHCNYLVVYEQHSSLEPVESIDPSYKKLSNGTFMRTDLQNKNIPEFSPPRVEPYSIKETDFTTNMSFSKTQLPKAAEVRFHSDGFNELSSLAAVHDVSMDTSFLTTIYPGVLCWVEPDFVDGPDVYGSIPWTVGIGGFHLITKVSHSFDVNARRIKLPKTKIEAKFVDSGASGAEVRFFLCQVDAELEQSFPDNNAKEQ